MKILITGSSGFLGRHLSPRLEEEGHEVTKLNSRNCDLTDKANLKRFDRTKYDQIFHLAAWTQAGDFCLHHPGEQWIMNQQMHTNLLAWWHESQPQAKMIAMGTSCCYDENLEHKEVNILKGEPIESLYTYAMTKRMMLLGMQMLNKQFGNRYLLLVPSTLYGPGYHTDGRQLHFIYDLARKIVEGKERGDPVVLWGDGEQIRELIHVNDFVRAAIQLSNSIENDTVNIGNGEGHTIREFAGMLCDIVGYDPGRITYDISKYLGARKKVLSSDKFARLLPGFQFTPLRQGLEEVVHWYQSTPN